MKLISPKDDVFLKDATESGVIAYVPPQGRIRSLRCSKTLCPFFFVFLNFCLDCPFGFSI